MRYIYQEPVITTVEDRILSGDEVLKVITEIQSKNQSISIVIENDGHLKKFDSARILAINGYKFSLHAYFQAASVKYSDIDIDNIKEIRVIAGKGMMQSRRKVVKWHSIEAAELG